MIQKIINSAALGVLVLVQAGCATTPQGPDQSALLLVSLEDGSIIQQNITANADVCMKNIEESTTTCFTRSEPILEGDKVIGYPMVRSEIHLVAK